MFKKGKTRKRRVVTSHFPTVIYSNRDRLCVFGMNKDSVHTYRTSDFNRLPRIFWEVIRIRSVYYFLDTYLGFTQRSFKCTFLFFLGFPTCRYFLIVQRRANPCRILTKAIRTFTKTIHFLVFPIQITIVSYLCMIRHPISIFKNVLSNIKCTYRIMKSRHFCSTSTKTNRYRCETRRTIIRRLSFRFFHFLAKVGVICIRRGRTQQSNRTITFTMKGSATKNGMKRYLLLRRAVNFFVPIFHYPTRNLNRYFRTFTKYSRFMRFLWNCFLMKHWNKQLSNSSNNAILCQ